MKTNEHPPVAGPGSLYVSTRNSETLWLMQVGPVRGFGDEIWRTEAEAISASENFLRRQADRKASAERQAADDARKAVLKAEREDLNGFDSGMTPMQRGRVVKILTTERVWRGKVTTRRDIVRVLVAEGRTIGIADGKRVLIAADGCFCDVTDTGADYAEFLIAKLNP